MLRRATFAGENWIARFGHLLDKAPSRQFNIIYDSLVNAVRDETPVSVERICAKAVAVETSAERQPLGGAFDLEPNFLGHASSSSSSSSSSRSSSSSLSSSA